MSVITQRIDYEAIDQRAREVRPGLALVHIVGTLIYGISWLLTHLAGYAFFAVVWMGMAVVTGASEGWKDTPTARAMELRRQAAAARAAAR